MLCEISNNGRKLQAIARGETPKAEATEKEIHDLLLYPGQTMRLYGEFTLANCPWRLIAHNNGESNVSGTKGYLEVARDREAELKEQLTNPGQEVINPNPPGLEGPGALPNSGPAGGGYQIMSFHGGFYPGRYTATGYSFDNLFVDWGDGSVEPLSVVLKESKETDVFGFGGSDPGGIVFDYNDVLQLDVEHKYTAPGVYYIRVYVLPEANAGQAGAVANLNNENVASSSGADFFARHGILLAAVGSSGMPGNIGQAAGGSLAGGFSRVGEEARSRAYQVYCNPIDIYVKQDPVATGPLQLKDIRITSFSTETAAAAAAPQQGSGGDEGGESGGTAFLTAKKIGTSRRHGNISTSWPAQGGISEAITPQVAGQGAVAEVSECDYGLWAAAELDFLGQGYAEVTWKVDGVVLHQERIPVGPSTLRSDFGTGDTEPIISTFHLDSPRLPVDELGQNQESLLHRVEVSARVVADDTMSLVNGAAMAAVMNPQGTALGGSQPVVPVSESSLQVSPYSNATAFVAGQINTASRKASHKSRLRQSASSGDVRGSVVMPGHSVSSRPRQYKVIKNQQEKPCYLRFPVEEGGEFIIANLVDMTESGGAASGRGVLVFNLPDSAYSTKEHFVPVSFSGWQLDDEARVLVGQLDVAAEKSIDALPAVHMELLKLSGEAGVHLNASFDIELADTTYYQGTSQSVAPQKWSGVTAPLSPQGDWYSPAQAIENRLRLGWSLVNITAEDGVYIDLSQKEGRNPGAKNISGPANTLWVGVDLGTQLKVYPYSFNLNNNFYLEGKNWGIDAQGVFGSSRTDEGQTFPFGTEDGTIEWKGIGVVADKGDITTTYDSITVHMTWPETTLKGENIVLQYTGDTVEPQLTLKPQAPISEDYGLVTMELDDVKFESRYLLWGLSGVPTFTFKEKGNDDTWTLTTERLFFTMDNIASFADSTHSSSKSGLTGHDIPSGLTFGNAGITPDASTVKLGKRLLDFTHHVQLSLGSALNSIGTTISYAVAGNSGATMESAMPEMGPLEGEISVAVAGGGRPDATESDITGLKYEGTPAMKMAYRRRLPHYGPLLASYHAASPAFWQGGLYNAWMYPTDDFFGPQGAVPILLAGTDGGAAVQFCDSDTFSGHVNTSLLGSSEKFEMSFRYGKKNGKDYWKMAVLTQALPGIPVFAGVFAQPLGGGIGYNLDGDTILGHSDCSDPGNFGLSIALKAKIYTAAKDVFAGDGELRVKVGQERVEVELDNVTLVGINMGVKAKTIFSSSIFQSTLAVEKTFFNDLIYINGGAGIELSDNWHAYIGTLPTISGEGSYDYNDVGYATASLKNLPVVNKLDGGAKMQFSEDGFKTDMYAGFDLKSGKVMDCQLSLYADATGALLITVPGFTFYGSLGMETGVTFENPVHNLNISAGAQFDFGCCSPVLLRTRVWVNTGCVLFLKAKGGVSLEIAPEFSFSPLIKIRGCGPL